MNNRIVLKNSFTNSILAKKTILTIPLENNRDKWKGLSKSPYLDLLAFHLQDDPLIPPQPDQA